MSQVSSKMDEIRWSNQVQIWHAVISYILKLHDKPTTLVVCPLPVHIDNVSIAQ